MIKLYGSGQSRSFRALWALEEAQVAFEYVEVTRDLLASEAYLSLNPQSKIPTLVDDDLVLTESAAIVSYAAACSEHVLVPADSRARAQFDDMCYFIMTDFEQPLWTIGKHRFALPEEHRREVVLETARWEFAKSQDALLQRMSDRRFAVGDQFTMADVLLAQTLNWALRFEMDVDGSLVEYKDRQYERDACKASLQRIGA